MSLWMFKWYIKFENYRLLALKIVFASEWILIYVMLNEKFQNFMRNLKINTRRATQRIKFHICQGKYNFVFLEIPRKFICPCYVERQDFTITVSFFSTDAALMIMMVTNCYNIISGAVLLYKVCYILLFYENSWVW